MHKSLKIVLVMMGPVAAYVAASEPMFVRATASPQPAFVASDQAASRLAPTGFNQAQGRP